MTDEQIIKSAERHKLGNCSQCDYKNYGSNCLHELLNDSCKMAKRLCDDVADLEEGYNDGIVIIGRLKAELKKAKAEIERLQTRNDELNILNKQVAQETIKEFEERIKQEITFSFEIQKVFDNLVKEMTEGK